MQEDFGACYFKRCRSATRDDDRHLEDNTAFSSLKEYLSGDDQNQHALQDLVALNQPRSLLPVEVVN